MAGAIVALICIYVAGFAWSWWAAGFAVDVLVFSGGE
jgi:hypothetical protein